VTNLPSFRKKLFDRQGGKCAGCQTQFESHKGMGRCRVGGVQFVACGPCASTSGEYQSFDEFVREHSTGSRQARLTEQREARHKVRVPNPAAYQRLAELVKEMGGTEAPPPHFGFLPDTVPLERIAWHLVHGNYSADERRQRKKEKELRRRKRRDKGAPSGNSRQNLKNKLAEAQGGQCYYCTCELTFEKTNTVADWFYATFEHLKSLPEVGAENFNDRNNMVLACHFCNEERSKTRMSAAQFMFEVRSDLARHERLRMAKLRPPYVSHKKWLTLNRTGAINTVLLMTNAK
jgi:hypothetical protein